MNNESYMVYWSYRLLRHVDGTVSMIEAYYDDNHKVVGYVEADLSRYENDAELKTAMRIMDRAFSLPILNHTEVPSDER